MSRTFCLRLKTFSDDIQKGPLLSHDDLMFFRAAGCIRNVGDNLFIPNTASEASISFSRLKDRIAWHLRTV